MESLKKIESIVAEIASLRNEWRRVRGERLSLKEKLVAGGMAVAAIRKHREYRALKKEQRRLFVLIRQRERRLNRLRAVHGEMEEKS
jgi:hypothetical protein